MSVAASRQKANKQTQTMDPVFVPEILRITSRLNIRMTRATCVLFQNISH